MLCRGHDRNSLRLRPRPGPASKDLNPYDFVPPLRGVAWLIRLQAPLRKSVLRSGARNGADSDANVGRSRCAAVPGASRR
jgi:hypothetical protein